jgi:hypothetical protein
VGDISRQPLLQELECWEVFGRIDSAQFFRVLSTTVPDATTIFLEGNSIADDVHNFLGTFTDIGTYTPEPGTIWPRSWKLRVRFASEVLGGLSDLAENHAEPEICDHLHVYRYDDRLMEWYDAFTDPLFIAASVPESRVQRFCKLLRVEYRHRTPAV